MLSCLQFFLQEPQRGLGDWKVQWKESDKAFVERHLHELEDVDEETGQVGWCSFSKLLRREHTSGVMKLSSMIASKMEREALDPTLYFPDIDR